MMQIFKKNVLQKLYEVISSHVTKQQMGISLQLVFLNKQASELFHINYPDMLPSTAEEEKPMSSQHEEVVNGQWCLLKRLVEMFIP